MLRLALTHVESGAIAEEAAADSHPTEGSPNLISWFRRPLYVVCVASRIKNVEKYWRRSNAAIGS